uniref:Ig-like domain-containing protein n=1 Tax=Erpetoichthys calabaricus TaxID=27687 RepID=A0A8C4TQ73_ERPCA
MGDTVTLKCNTEGGFTGWNYYRWYKGDQTNMGNQIYSVNGQTHIFQLVAQSYKGSYRCKAYSYSSPRYSQISSPFTLAIKENPKTEVKLNNEEKPIYMGDTVTLKCNTEGGFTGWNYYWWYKEDQTNMGNQINSVNGQTYTFQLVAQTDKGSYRCKAYSYSSPRYSQTSHPVTLTTHERTAKLALNSKQIFEGDQVILYCQVDGNPAGWEYELCWNGCEKPYKSNVKSTFTISPVNVSHSGVYKCRAGKGGIYSKYSNDVQLQVSERTAKLALNSKQIFEGDQVIFYCQVDGDLARWNYELFRNGCEKPYKSDMESNFTISPVNVSHSGVYKCRAGKGGIYSKYSNDVQLQVS